MSWLQTDSLTCNEVFNLKTSSFKKTISKEKLFPKIINIFKISFQDHFHDFYQDCENELLNFKNLYLYISPGSHNHLSIKCHLKENQIRSLWFLIWILLKKLLILSVDDNRSQVRRYFNNIRRCSLSTNRWELNRQQRSWSQGIVDLLHHASYKLQHNFSSLRAGLHDFFVVS